jgi:hypothetical protein
MIPSFPPQLASPLNDGLTAPRTFPIISITQDSKTYHVLSLSGPSGTHNPLSDLVLPSMHAFTEEGIIPVSYPTFGAANCSWFSIFSLVQRPTCLWESYAPRNLGEYPNVSSLWLAWSEGDFLDGVGRLPSLQHIDQMWGSQKNQNHEGRQPEWRPKKNAMV